MGDFFIVGKYNTARTLKRLHVLPAYSDPFYAFMIKEDILKIGYL